MEHNTLVEARAHLRKHWGYEDFRPLQAKIINSVLSNESTLALLPTGGGKSLCYQVPALVKDGVTIVVSPLIALMQEQVSKLKSLGIQAEVVNSSLNYGEVKSIFQNTVEGAYKLLYISPERIQTDLFKQYLPEFDLSYLAIDEAHCISEWGHDFRPAYLQIKYIKEVFKKVPVIALTASATPKVVEDITVQLGLATPSVYKDSFERTNIQYNVTYTEQKQADLLALLNNNGTTIIYCRTRRQVTILANQLHTHGKNVTIYHAGLSREQRDANFDNWMNGTYNIMIATIAFGMGIDKADVRQVIHYDIPENLENYYQESGRAGRDGQTAKSVLLFNWSDTDRLKNSIDIQFPPIDYLRHVYQSVAEYLQIPTGIEPYKYYDFDISVFCQRFNHKANVALRAIKLLEQEGLWTLTDSAYKAATIQITAERREIDSLTRNYPDLGMVLTVLLRLYSNIYYYPTTINLRLIAKHLRIKKDLTVKLLEQLDKMEYLRFNQPKEGSQLFFHHYRVDSKQLIIDTNRINALKKTYIERINAVINYTTNTDSCRTKMLLSYFSEEKNNNCGHCDYCLSLSSANHTNLEEVILKLLDRSTSLAITEVVSNLQEYKKDDVVDMIRSLIDSRKVLLHEQAISLNKQDFS